MYENRFLCGVEGVRDEGRDDEALLLLFGGVCARVPSCVCDPDGTAALSGDKVEGVIWGTVSSKSSARSKVEKVLFASSAKDKGC